MSKQRIVIVTDKGLPERSARIHIETWEAVKAKSPTGFFPEGNQILVGNNPFDPMYILFAVDNDIPKEFFFVSEDVKNHVYPHTTHFEF